MFVTRQLKAAAAFAFWLAAAGIALAEPAVTGVRIGPRDETLTRVVLDLSAPIRGQASILADPDRLVIDLSSASWRLPSASAKVGIRLVKGYRYSVFDTRTSRLVLELAGPARIVHSFGLPQGSGSPDRYVVDLAPAASGAPPVAGAPPQGPGQMGRIPLPYQKPKQLSLTVVVDPGHGGVDTGTIGGSGATEKSIVLSVAEKLRDSLRKRGYRVVMTRDSDVYPSLDQRVAIARRVKGDLFISLHADSNQNASLRGASVYTLSDKASDAETAELARKENRSDAIAGVDISGEADDVSWIIIDMTISATLNQSARFARTVTAELREAAPMIKNPHRFAGFKVLKAADVPSVLIELGLLSSRADEARLADETAQRRSADAIARAVDRYFEVQRRAALN